MNGETELTAAFNLCSLCFDKTYTQSQIVTDLNGVKTSSDMLAPPSTMSDHSYDKEQLKYWQLMVRTMSVIH